MSPSLQAYLILHPYNTNAYTYFSHPSVYHIFLVCFFVIQCILLQVKKVHPNKHMFQIIHSCSFRCCPLCVLFLLFCFDVCGSSLLFLSKNIQIFFFSPLKLKKCSSFTSKEPQGREGKGRAFSLEVPETS